MNSSNFARIRSKQFSTRPCAKLKAVAGCDLAIQRIQMKTFARNGTTAPPVIEISRTLLLRFVIAGCDCSRCVGYQKSKKNCRNFSAKALSDPQCESWRKSTSCNRERTGHCIFNLALAFSLRQRRPVAPSKFARIIFTEIPNDEATAIGPR